MTLTFCRSLSGSGHEALGASHALRPVIMGTNAMVSSGHYLATLAGVNILAQGGNAVDAGVAVGLCTNVLLPDMTSVGGVAPIILYLAETHQVATIAGLGPWPLAASTDFFLEKCGGDLPLGVLRSVVPSAMDAWITALDKYGTMTLAQVAQPAIDLAQKGFPYFDILANEVHEHAHQYAQWPATAGIFLTKGHLPRVGEVLVQRDLAHTLRRMVEEERMNTSRGRHAGLMAARDLFYIGEIGRAVVRFCQEQGGFLSAEDLASYHSRLEPPAKITFGDYEVYSCGPWCQGPVLLQALNLLEGEDLASLGHNSAGYIHLVTEALKLAFADRETYYGDPAFVDVPLDKLLAKEYARKRRGLIDPERAQAQYQAEGLWAEGVAADSEHDTSYFCVVDAQGNAFSATPSDSIGSTPIVPGLGFIISSRGSQSWLNPHHPSSLEPGKRPRLTPNPALVLKGGHLALAFGTPGGDVQCQAMLQFLLNLRVWGMNVQEAIEAPRFATRSFPGSFHPHEFLPNRLSLESRIPADVRAQLQRKGHDVAPWADWDIRAGGLCAILVDETTGTLMGGADPRRMGYAMGW